MDAHARTQRRRRLRSRASALGALIGVGASILFGCENNALGPGGDVDVVPQPPYISEPVSPPPISPGGIQSELVVRSATDSVSYVSFPPETFPGADSLLVDNLANGATAGAPLFEGGLDPLPIAASVGDTLQLTVWTGAVGEVMFRGVPLKHAITVVRTKPRRGRTSVPINLSVAVIFSEPADPASVNSQTVLLLRAGQPVPADVQLRPDGLAVEIIPAGLLAHETTHTILVTTDVRDLSGDPLPTEFQSEFTTAATQLTGKMVFQSSRSGLPELYAMDAEGGEATRLTYRVAGGGASQVPDVSPDGRQIAFTVMIDSPVGPVMADQTYVMNVDGTGLRILDPHPDGAWGPKWSPDGSKIAFCSWRSGDNEIWVMNADGSDPINLTNSETWDCNPAWSPDGSRIAFNSNREGMEEIYLMNADGTGVSKLVSGPQRHLPTWSPDGSRIAFVVAELFVINLDGSGLENLTEGRAGIPDMPAWSPDGRQIAYVSAQANGHGIYVIEQDGTEITRLTAGPDSWPAWSP